MLDVEDDQLATGVARWFGLGTYWDRPLRAELQVMGARPNLRGAWAPTELRHARQRLISASNGLGPAHFRALALRMSGLPATALKSRVRGAPTQQVLDRWALAYLLACGSSVHGPTLDLGQCGFPPRGQADVPRATVLRLWLRGSSRRDLAQRCQLEDAQVDRLLANAPRRLHSRDVSARFGWSRDVLHQSVARGSFPSSAGRDDRGRWWWEFTIDLWANTSPLRTCPVCAARVLGLAQHLRSHAEPTRAQGAG